MNQHKGFGKKYLSFHRFPKIHFRVTFLPQYHTKILFTSDELTFPRKSCYCVLKDWQNEKESSGKHYESAEKAIS